MVLRGIIEKFVGCFLVYPFLGGGWWLKSVKRVCICDYDKNHIFISEKCFSRFELGYKLKSVPGSPKTYC